MSTNKIDFVLRTTSPMFIAYPDNYDDKAKVSRTTKKPVLIGNSVAYLPYYPGNGFRGGLRRMAANRIATYLAETEGPIPGDLYNGLRCGAASGSPDKTALSIEEIARARKHAYMGLFGGGARIHESMYRVTDMNPIIETTVKLGIVPNSYKDLVLFRTEKETGEPQFVQPRQLVGERTSIRVDDLYRIEDFAGLMRVVSNPLETVAEHQRAIGTNKEDRKTDPAAKKADVGNMMTFEAIAEGTRMHFRIDLDRDLTSEQLGLLLLAFSDLFNENMFGGWVRVGMGKVRVESIKMTYNDETKYWDNLYNDESFVLPADVREYTDAAEKAIKGMKIAELADYFTDFSAGGKAEKKAKAQAKKAETEAEKSAA